MAMEIIRFFKSFPKLFFYFWEQRGFLIRAFLCWVIGIIILYQNDTSSFDLRFKIRGHLPTSNDIVIISITREDWNVFFKTSRTYFRPQSRILEITDSSYWNKNLWKNILSQLIKADAKGIAVTFFFGDNIKQLKIKKSEKNIFQNDRIIWAANLDSRNRVLPPQLANEYSDNIGLGGIEEDEDGIVRRFHSPLVGTPHLAARLAEKLMPLSSIDLFFPNKLPINYHGPLESYTTITLSDFLNKKIPLSFFKNKLVIIGTNTLGHRFFSPVGPLSRAEIFANITENILNQMWIKHLDNIWYSLFLLLQIFFSVLIIFRYPNNISFVFYLWIAILICALSIWSFDSQHFWLPVLPPLVVLFSTWLVFYTYKSSFLSKQIWRLKQEQKYLIEIELLKNNFINLISHDLKTPIAKIQAITDRLLTQYPNFEFSQDLFSLRKSSDELLKYIRSILYISKVESREFKLNKEVIDINELIERNLEQLDTLVAEKEIWIEKKLEPMFSMELDSTLIGEVILNLIENAIKYSPKQGKITLISKEENNQVTFLVQDKGEGISEEEQKVIWHKFVRGKQQDLKTKGTGLGLYLVKYFIELHRGKIHFESELGKGTTIGFSLPLTDEESLSNENIFMPNIEINSEFDLTRSNYD